MAVNSKSHRRALVQDKLLFDGTRMDVGAFVAELGPVWLQGYLV
ncbi:MAG: hypothetical protein QM492_04410 [Rhodobacterales bacterium]